MPTHDLGMREEERGRRQVFPAAERRPAKIAQLAERFGSYSVWCSDHILVTSKPGAASHALCRSGAEPVPNKRLQATANSLRSCVAPAIGGA
jgi:alkanesulfonate monooxygenase SsuD/methylene tetrahydromethanopterin reductase-like flavin-dependent oxidoreductase (luciferase family)